MLRRFLAPKKRNFKAHASGYQKYHAHCDLRTLNKKRNFKARASGSYFRRLAPQNLRKRNLKTDASGQVHTQRAGADLGRAAKRVGTTGTGVEARLGSVMAWSILGPTGV